MAAEADSPYRTAQRASISEERRRMVRSRRYLQAALAHPSSDWPAMLALVRACIDHLIVSGARLVAQDLDLAVRLRPTLPAERAEDHAFLNELETRLRLRKQEQADLATAMAVLAATGEAGLPAFMSAVDRFFNAPSQNSSRPMHSLPPLLEAYGSPDAWTHAQDAAEACGSEQIVFDRIAPLAYEGLDELVAAAERDAPPRRRPHAA